ncbi:MAG: lipid-A-disaccharide synthase [Akkermansiaceae bacterium]|nr:lipid-A-disaccharide synthase [Akkermansiaceae bacterium]
MKRLFLVAGEVSGDTHGAALMRSLPARKFEMAGLGGPLMHAVSGAVEDWLDEAAVLGLWEVLRKYGYFKKKMEETVARIFAEKPDGVVLIDYPGYNLRLAKRLREGGYTGKLIYYISPQVWAWKKGRIKTMAALLDRMICIFPFEKALYESSGLPTVFAGHPLVDSLAAERDAGIARDENLVALLPGSRSREVEALFPPMLAAARILGMGNRELRFVSAAANAKLEARMREMASEAGLDDVLEIEVGTVHEVMQRSVAGVVASGTATLEAACFGLPYCLVYRVAWLTYVVGRLLVEVEFLGIVNVIAGREVVRELLQGDATGPKIAAELSRLLGDAAAREALRIDLAGVVETLGAGGAHGRAAEAVMEALDPAAAESLADRDF